MNFDFSAEPIDEGNWNLETWRKEEPMDYLKAVSILNKAEDSVEKTAVFKAIFSVAKLHVPEVLFKYYSLSNDKELNDKKLQTLMNRKIYMSEFKDFNDPFDGKGFFYNPDNLKSIDWLIPYSGRLIDDFTAYFKGTSLTKNGVHSMPMWAHYGGNHTGFCVSYEMKENLELRSCTYPVQYTNERLDITKLIEDQSHKIEAVASNPNLTNNKEVLYDDLSLIYIPLLLCNLKHASWSYENEFRCTTAANAKGMPFIEAKPKEIYVGMNCSYEHTKRLIEIAANLRVPIFKMAFGECSSTYELTTEII